MAFNPNAAPSPFHTFVSMLSAEFAPTTILPTPTLNGIPSILSNTVQSAQVGSTAVTSASTESASTGLASSASTSPSTFTSLPHTSQSAHSGFESASGAPAYTPSFIFTTIVSDGHSVTETTFFPITTSSESSTTSPEPAVTQPTQQSSESKSISPLVVRAIVGSLVGVLVFSLAVFLYTRVLRRRRQRIFHKITPLTDLEDGNFTMASQRRPLSPINRNTQLDEEQEMRGSEEACLPKTQLLLQIQIPDSENNPLANSVFKDESRNTTSNSDSVRRVRAGLGMVPEMRARMHRMVEHVQRLEAEIEAGQERDSRNTILRSDGPPPTYAL